MTILEALKRLVRRVQELENPLNVVSGEQLDALKAIEEAEKVLTTGLQLFEACETAALAGLFAHKCVYHGPMICDKCVAVEKIRAAIAATEGQ